MDAIVRHWHILRMIPRHPRKITAGKIYGILQDTEAATHLTKRTVERDLYALAANFPLDFDGCKPQGWCWRRDSDALDIPGMDLTAALTFRMVEEYLGRLLPKTCYDSLSPHLKRARTILGDPGHGNLADWPEKVKIVPRSQPLLAPEVSASVMEVVNEALLRNQRFKGFYKRQGKEGREHVVSPLGLVFNDPVVYVVGICGDHTDAVLMALHRFTTAELLETPVTRPEKFDLQGYIDSGSLGFAVEPGATIRLAALFTRSAGAHLWESKLSSDQTISDDRDGWVRIEATVADTDQLRWWLLGFGEQAEVLSPESLRGELMAKFRDVSRLYSL